MEQHAVPQNISSYEFRLVGDMTLKQFFQLAGGIILGVVIFRLPLPVFIKYPLVFISVMAGILMAFVPINGRPFTAWITAFFRAIYSPTEFSWAPDTEIPTASNIAPIISATSPYHSTTTNTNTPATPSVATVTPSVPTPSKPEPVIIQPIAPLSVPTPPASPPIATQTSFSSYTPPPAPLSGVKETLSVSKPIIPPTPAPLPTTNNPPPTTNTPIAVGPVSQPLKNPVQPTALPLPTTHNQSLTTNAVPTPTQPNVLAGMVTDKSGAAIESAIVEITDSVTQIPARALRTNRTGLFQIVTPLKPSTYQITVEKEGLTFSPTSVVINGKIIQPIIIKSVS